MYLTLTADDVRPWSDAEREALVAWVADTGINGLAVTEARIVAEGRVEFTVLGSPPGTYRRLEVDVPAPPPFLDRWTWLAHHVPGRGGF